VKTATANVILEFGVYSCDEAPYCIELSPKVLTLANRREIPLKFN